MMVLYCCVGWSLEFAAQFLLWNELIIDVLWFFYSTISFIFYIQNIADPYYEFRYGYYIVWSIIGIITIILGLYAIKKNKPSLLNGFLYYLYYYVFFECCCLLLLIFDPPLYMDVFHRSIKNLRFPIKLNTPQFENVILTVAWYCFLIPNLIYFVIIVKSYRNETVINRSYGTSSVDYVTITLFGSKSKTALRRITTV